MLDDFLLNMVVQPCTMEPYVFMIREDIKYYSHYKYADVWMDDLIASSKSPQAIVDALINKWIFKLKGIWPISYYVRCDFNRDVNH